MAFTFRSENHQVNRSLNEVCGIIDSSIDCTRQEFINGTVPEELREAEVLAGILNTGGVAGEVSVTCHCGFLGDRPVYFFRMKGVEYVLTQERDPET